MKKQLLALSSRANDLAVGPILIVIGLMGLGGLLAIIAIPIIEAFILRLVRWDKRGIAYCLRDAYFTNLLSTIVGVAFGSWFLDVGGWSALAVMFAGTLVVEGAVLFALAHKRIWRRGVRAALHFAVAAVLPNVVTYALIAPLWLWLVP